MTCANAKAFHVSIGLGLLACAVCPVIEILCHTNDSIFQTGHDTETTLALLFLLLELTVAVLKLVIRIVSEVLSRLCRLGPKRVSFLTAALEIVVPTPSPPLPLRI